MKISEKIIEHLAENRNLSDAELNALLNTSEFDSLLFSYADKIRRDIYGDEVYIRGLKRNRLSGWLWIYGWFSPSDNPKSNF